ncbi:hypothetical protein F7725_018538 [Dissostichus mawsoni]|uniref:Hairy/enhancer-of-split related with YRPW motif protein 1 n=1 Tax=Dissostichus mawsoni TaxID=36200 RepID=A0A7J5XSH2_DISMA|nr:hypothetical protein F7725_018538 [Dissostichus mawsoni]
MKRSHNYSSSESDLDDNIEVEKDSGDENGQLDSHGSMSPSTTTQVQARKRRRGVRELIIFGAKLRTADPNVSLPPIIEKRRRDRINSSLSELRRLVPSAFEKQGSAKLEKAEILQMTVDHLKMLHASGGKGFFEAHALAKDYRSLGFRECLAETARYLSIIEGRDGTDPLRARLVSHLSNYASQREHTGLPMPISTTPYFYNTLWAGHLHPEAKVAHPPPLLFHIFLPLQRGIWDFQTGCHAPHREPQGAPERLAALQSVCANIQAFAPTPFIPLLAVGLPPLLRCFPPGVPDSPRHSEPLLHPLKALQAVGYGNWGLLNNWTEGNS